MKGIFHDMSNWFRELAAVWLREFKLVFSDIGILLFFIALPLGYPIVYTLIYNPEVPTDIHVAVVDNCRTSQSRDLVRKIDATSAIEIVGYASSMTEARKWLAEKKCYGILEIPHDYSRKLGRSEQSVVPFYSDMGLLLRYRSFISALTDVQLATGAEIRSETLESAGLASMGQSAPVNNEAFFLGDTEQGFASFVIPGIVILILQQSMVLGIAMLAGTSAERRRKNGGIDPLQVDASPLATVLGKMLCYLVIYVPMTVYVLHYIPLMFSLPHIGNPADYFLFMLPMLIASAFFGMITELLVKEREMSMMVVVFTSVVFLFLSGLTWPRYAMSDVWYWIGNCVPAVWGVEGFIRINSNGASLADNATPYCALWILSAVYFVAAYMIARYRRNKEYALIKNKI